ncbi:MAG: metallophosphoesterase family protein, partial [Promethearchaeota archaeon]
TVNTFHPQKNHFARCGLMRSYPKHAIPEFLQQFIENPADYMQMCSISPFTLAQLGQIWTLYLPISQQYPNLIRLDEFGANFNNLLIIGDTHGDFQATIRIVQPFLEGKVDSLLFLGDYVDRGKYGFLNLIFLLSLSIIWPDRVILLRGNHEDLEINLLFGFYNELQSYFPRFQEFQAVLAIMDALYNLMSIVAITPQHSVCMHAGIPKNNPNLTIFDSLPKPHKEYRKIVDKKLKQEVGEAFMEVRWNDPTEQELVDPDSKSYHGYFYYTASEVQHFLKLNGQKRIIRSHEDIRKGFQEVFLSQLYHVFSSEPYYDGSIEQGFTIHEQSDGQIVLRDLDFTLIRSLS